MQVEDLENEKEELEEELTELRQFMEDSIMGTTPSHSSHADASTSYTRPSTSEMNGTGYSNTHLSKFICQGLSFSCSNKV